MMPLALSSEHTTICQVEARTPDPWRFLAQVPESLRPELLRLLRLCLSGEPAPAGRIVAELEGRLRAALAAGDVEPARRPAITALVAAISTHRHQAVLLVGAVGRQP